MLIVKNQAEFDKAVKDGVSEMEITGDEYIVNTKYSGKIMIRVGSPRIVNRGSCSPSIENWGSCSPRIVNWGSCSPSIFEYRKNFKKEVV